MKVRVVGIGGYGKWVASYLKSRLVEESGDEIRADIGVLAFDMIGQETNPAVAYSGYVGGQQIQLSLAYSRSARERPLNTDFFHYQGDWEAELRAVRTGHGSEYISAFVTPEAARYYVLGGRAVANPAGEMRITSRVSFFLDYENVRKRLESFLVDDCTVYLVASVAGGTGSGSFLDFLLLIQDILADRKWNRVTVATILALPATFKSAKEGEPFNALPANAYAAFRELFRMNVKGHKLDMEYPPDGHRPSQKWDVLSRLTYVVDGTIDGQPNRKKHYDSSVPMIADFILASRNKLEGDEVTDGGSNAEGEFQTGTMMDNMLTQLGTQQSTSFAMNHPEKTFGYNSFGIGRVLVDEKCLKESLGQALAMRVLGNYLAPSWRGEAGIRELVQDFTRNRAGGFVRHVCYPSRDSVSVTEEWLRSALNAAATPSRVRGTTLSRLTFTEKKHQSFMQAGTLHKESALLQQSAEAFVGSSPETDEDVRKQLTDGPAGTSISSILHWHRAFWKQDFDNQLRTEVLDILKHEDKQHPWGNGGLHGALDFLTALGAALDSYGRSFTQACNDDKAKSSAELAESLDAFVKEKGQGGTQYFNLFHGKKEITADGAGLIQKYRDYVARRVLEMTRGTVADLVDHCCDSIRGVREMVATWIATFEKGQSYIKQAESDLRSHRTDLRKIIDVDTYVTEPGDGIEQTILDTLAPDTPADSLRKIPDTIRASVVPVDLAGLARDFDWSFNLRRAEDRTLSHPEEPEGSLLCSLPSDYPSRYLPPWKDLDAIGWNYRFTNYYLERCVLNQHVQTDVVDMLIAKDMRAADVARDACRAAAISLAYNNRVHNGTREDFKEEQATPESMEKLYVYADKARWGKTNLPIKKEWVATFKKEIEEQHHAVLVPVANELGITSAEIRSLLTPAAMTSLQDCRTPYWDAAQSGRPIHVLAGEACAVGYERDLSLLLGSEPHELHPLVVGALDDEPLLINMMLAQLLELARWAIVAGKTATESLDAYVIRSVPASSGGSDDVSVVVPASASCSVRQSISAASLELRTAIPGSAQAKRYHRAVEYLDSQVRHAFEKTRPIVIGQATERYTSLLHTFKEEPPEHPIERDEMSVELIVLARLLNRVPNK